MIIETDSRRRCRQRRDEANCLKVLISATGPITHSSISKQFRALGMPGYSGNTVQNTVRDLEIRGIVRSAVSHGIERFELVVTRAEAEKLAKLAEDESVYKGPPRRIVNGKRVFVLAETDGDKAALSSGYELLCSDEKTLWTNDEQIARAWIEAKPRRLMAKQNCVIVCEPDGTARIIFQAEEFVRTFRYTIDLGPEIYEKFCDAAADALDEAVESAVLAVAPEAFDIEWVQTREDGSSQWDFTSPWIENAPANILP